MSAPNVPVIHAILPPKSKADELHNIHAHLANAARNRAMIQSAVGGNPILDEIGRITVSEALAEYHRSANTAAAISKAQGTEVGKEQICKR